MEYFNGNDLHGDLCIMECIMDQIKFYSGTERKKMIKVPPSIGGSMLYGLTWRAYLKKDPITGDIITRRKHSKGLYYTKIMDDHPDLQDIFNEFGKKYLSEFEFTQVQLNKNFPCPPHQDSKNTGESIVVAFGDFTGGETTIWFNGQDKPSQSIISHNNLIKFNGSKYWHKVEPFTGTRYSLVFFNRATKKRIINIFKSEPLSFI